METETKRKLIHKVPVLYVSSCNVQSQFNHQSTRGHCIMTLEVEMPHPDMPGMKQKGRVYVCDLAGTEPAGDIVYALYDKKVTWLDGCVGLYIQ